MRYIPVLILAFMAPSCIGTDFIDEPLRPAAVQADIEERSLSLFIGESQRLNFRILASDGSETTGTWQWSSRNETVATVGSDGLVTAINIGQAWVDGIVNTVLRDSVLITVVADLDAVASVIIEGDATNLQLGESRQLAATVRNAQGQMLSGIPIEWNSSNPDAITIDNSGLARAAGEGAAEITAVAAGVSSVPFRLEAGSGASVRSGAFSGLNGYNVQGTATLTQSSSGAMLTFGSDFLSQSGPGLYVYLSPQQNSVAGGVQLGKLSANSGAQSYAIPSAVNLAGFGFVIIYCQPFGIPFGACALQ